ncbi:MAG: ABC transporter ATP-binding protein [Andreesenia angusta]|nr:ABC transporter ATP-binding protein [Andreesenia angusta]
MIELVNISKKYDENYIMKDLNFKIPDGEICIFIGPSGCGKSTVLKMINKMEDITEGKIYIDGKDIDELNENELRKNIGYVIQQIGLLPHRTVKENISIVPRLFKWEKERIYKRVDELLRIVGLNPDEYRDKYPKELSGGQMQRVGVARALAVEPPIMLMDEPFGAVDPINRKKIQENFLEIHSKLKKTICFVTHDIDEALKMGDRIAIFNDKNIVQYDTPRNILLYPKNEFVKEFIGEDRINKALRFIKVKEVLANKSDINTDIEPKIVLSEEDDLETVFNTMVINSEEFIGIEESNGSIKNISFENLSDYIKSLEGKF